MSCINSFKCHNFFEFNKNKYFYYSLKSAEKNGLEKISIFPFCIKVLIENLLRFENGSSIVQEDIMRITKWIEDRGRSKIELSYYPSRVLMQDFTGIPALVDLAAMRESMIHLNGDPEKINPVIPVDLIIDHSIIVEDFGNKFAEKNNMKLEYQRNEERYHFLKWSQKSFKKLRIVPPGVGICHQVNLEYLSKVICCQQNNEKTLVFPDTCIGTDSHTTMVNSLGVLGWGVGGIEAEAAILGESINMLLPEVVGIKIVGNLMDGVTATDLVLKITEILRKKNVVGKFVEFFGPGLKNMTLENRATISNMSPEYGATCSFFPIDDETIKFLKKTGRDQDHIKLIETYARIQGIWKDSDTVDPKFTDVVEIDMQNIVPSISGPKRPERRIELDKVKELFNQDLQNEYKKDITNNNSRFNVVGEKFDLGHGDIVIAAITSCTNTSNPDVMITAGLLARNAVMKGLRRKSWVKTSLAPGSKVVESYLLDSGLQEYLDILGFQIVGFGCTTCIGNSGSLSKPISNLINSRNLIVVSILSGNRNFEGRVSPDVLANYLASPPIVVAYSIAGTIKFNPLKDSLGVDFQGNEIFLRDIWPSSKEVKQIIETKINRKLFIKNYENIYKGNFNWKNINAPLGKTYTWDDHSTYVRCPPFFSKISKTYDMIDDVKEARILCLLGDKITTDHISPAGTIRKESPAGIYLMNHGISEKNFNQYGTRRGNHEIMIRGTFANVQIQNFILGNNKKRGGYTLHFPDRKEESIYSVAMRYQKEKIPLVVIAGTEYGNGSSRDWAAKGTSLLGVKIVIAGSFERIHKSNLIGMGVFPFTFANGENWRSLGILGNEKITIEGLSNLQPQQKILAKFFQEDGKIMSIPLIFCIDTIDELNHIQCGGVLQSVFRKLIKDQKNL